MMTLRNQKEGNTSPRIFILLDTMCFIVSLEIGRSVYHYFFTIINVFSWYFAFQMTQ